MVSPETVERQKGVFMLVQKTEATLKDLLRDFADAGWKIASLRRRYLRGFGGEGYLILPMTKDGRGYSPDEAILLRQKGDIFKIYRVELDLRTIWDPIQRVLSYKNVVGVRQSFNHRKNQRMKRAWFHFILLSEFNLLMRGIGQPAISRRPTLETARWR